MGYDVVVIGGGSAGCVLASRLSEDARRRVMLVEAGPDHADVNAVPPDVLDASEPTVAHDWGYAADAVLDAYGSVHGTQGLTIADASIMPTIPTATTNIPTIMVAEHIARRLRSGEVGPE